jgi:predicted Zn-dependent protease
MAQRLCQSILVLFLLAPAFGAQGDAYSIAKEQALGDRLAAEYRRSASLPGNAAVNAYLNDLGQRIVAHAGGAPYPYTFELVGESELFLNEPVAFPGGKIFVPTGLILAARSEDEIAGMMAHAIAHVAARQGARQGTNQPPAPLIFMGGWQGYAVKRNQQAAVPLGFLSAYRQNELDADALAVQSMAAAGYNPAALNEYIARLQPGTNGSPAPNRPYPDRDARLASIRAAIAKLPPAAYAAHDGFASLQEQVRRLSATPAKPPPRLAR